MDENDRKERFSLAYISAVAAHAGFLVTEPDGPDKISIDGLIMSDEDRQPIVAFQAKATTRNVGAASTSAFLSQSRTTMTSGPMCSDHGS
jgi:hypothetical protein